MKKYQGETNMANNKKYCPILMIGFDPPKGNASYDPRECKRDCAWYNKDSKECSVHLISEILTEHTETLNMIAEANITSDWYPDDDWDY